MGEPKIKQNITDSSSCIDPKIIETFWNNFFLKIENIINEDPRFKDLSKEEKIKNLEKVKEVFFVVSSKNTLKKEILDLKIETQEDVNNVIERITNIYREDLERCENEKKYSEQKRIFKDFPRLVGTDLSHLDFSNLSKEQLLISWYDDDTKWPPSEKLPEGFNPEKLMEEGKNPGLGIKDLHKRGITGKGINVAIIDQKISSKHQEYKDNIVLNEIEKVNEGQSMHGLAAASILVGENCGVAPEACLDFYSTPCSNEYFPYSKSLNDIIERNKNSDEKNKIRIVSVSWGENPVPGLDEWKETIKTAENDGIIVLNTDNVSKFHGGGSYENKEDFDGYKPAIFCDLKTEEKLKDFSEEYVIVPSDYRTYASRKGDNKYEHTGDGGLSWMVPYLAGLMALGLQVNPKLNREQLENALIETAITNKIGVRIVNPKGFIEKLERVEK